MQRALSPTDIGPDLNHTKDAIPYKLPLSRNIPTAIPAVPKTANRNVKVLFL
jgi:hypothetical protein